MHGNTVNKFLKVIGVLAGLSLKLRPTLLPYFGVVHALMDITTVVVYLMI